MNQESKIPLQLNLNKARTFYELKAIPSVMGMMVSGLFHTLFHYFLEGKPCK